MSNNEQRTTSKRKATLPPCEWVAADRRNEYPSVLVFAEQENRSFDDLKAWQFWCRFICQTHKFDTIWAIDGCERHEKVKAETYLRHRAGGRGVRRIEVFEYVPPPSREEAAVISRHNLKQRELHDEEAADRR